MVTKRSAGIVVVQDDEVLWISGNQPDAGRCLFRLPLDQVLTGDVIADRLPKAVRGNYKNVCIVPDHWLGMERYAFQSTRPALIEPFLERKLTAAFPDRKQVRHFFNYQSLAAREAEHGLISYFLQEEKGYQLYYALRKLDLAPRHITTPAFLWVDQLNQVSADFSRQGALLIHMGRQECRLYFYFRGHFIFSRDVALAESDDSMAALTFEINQSLYMFSQKTKTELNQVYLLATSSDSPGLFGEMLGREVIDLAPLLKASQAMAIEDAPFLDGLLQARDLAPKVSFFSLTHRKIKRELAWVPVQWAGIVIGALLLLPLIGENLMLGRMIQKEAAETALIQQQMDHSTMALGDYEQTLDRVLEAAERPVCADTVRRLLAGLPAGVRVQELSVHLEDQPAVMLKAKVIADTTEQLKGLLAQLVARVRVDFQSAGNFSINDIEVGADPSAAPEAASQYLIAMRLELT